MLKKILKLEGAQKLTKNEQKDVNGGNNCHSFKVCEEGYSWSIPQCACICDNCFS
jgi:hypothetical protein